MERDVCDSNLIALPQIVALKKSKKSLKSTKRAFWLIEFLGHIFKCDFTNLRIAYPYS